MKKKTKNLINNRPMALARLGGFTIKPKSLQKKMISLVG